MSINNGRYGIYLQDIKFLVMTVDLYPFPLPLWSLYSLKAVALTRISDVVLTVLHAPWY